MLQSVAEWCSAHGRWSLLTDCRFLWIVDFDLYGVLIVAAAGVAVRCGLLRHVAVC